MNKRPMKTINLKKYYYPICKKDTFVAVSYTTLDVYQRPEMDNRSPVQHSG